MPGLPRRQLKVAIALPMLCLMALANVRARADIPRLEAGAERGSIQKQKELAAAYFSGHGVQRDEEKAAFWYEKAANSGDPFAQEQIGYFYQAGIGVPRNPSRAAHWFQLAAAGGSVGAKVNLGVAYLWGLGVTQDQALAQQLFHEALDKGDGIAAGYIGEMHLLGIGVPKDTAKAQSWFTIGARMHDPHSEFRLANILASDGLQNENCLRRAASLLRASSKKGYIPAKHSLGLLLANHPDLSANPDEAIGNLEESAAAGTWKSSLVLGILARDGRGVPADPKGAYLHFQIAVRQGGDAARLLAASDLARLGVKLTLQDRNALDAEAADWVSKHRVPLAFTYDHGGSAFALTSPDPTLHTGRLMPNPD
jgi:uncharacterized protein